MGGAVSDVAEGLARVNSEVMGSWGVVGQLERAAGYLEEARALLDTFDDPAARAAHRETTMALDRVRQASYGWLNDGVNAATELIDRIKE